MQANRPFAPPCVRNTNKSATDDLVILITTLLERICAIDDRLHVESAGKNHEER